ncbi:hypothetical protein H2248_002779 [Termitomyces sp. 'cryptogamus']|nr:hypothetical protein H2248_002779 [Termitomyces sp. 'cryptogamus']
MSSALPIPKQVILHGPDTHPYDVSDMYVPGDLPMEGEIHNKKTLASNVILQSNPVFDDSFNPLGDTYGLQNYRERFLVDSIGCVAGVIFGLTHCLAWHSEFPSKAEQLLWRILSTVTSCLPIFVLVFAKSASWIINQPRPHQLKLSMGIYADARLLLLVDMFVVLRKQNPGIFTSVDWIDKIPHI